MTMYQKSYIKACFFSTLHLIQLVVVLTTVFAKDTCSEGKHKSFFEFNKCKTNKDGCATYNIELNSCDKCNVYYERFKKNEIEYFCDIKNALVILAFFCATQFCIMICGIKILLNNLKKQSKEKLESIKKKEQLEILDANRINIDVIENRSSPVDNILPKIQVPQNATDWDKFSREISETIKSNKPYDNNVIHEERIFEIQVQEYPNIPNVISPYL